MDESSCDRPWLLLEEKLVLSVEDIMKNTCSKIKGEIFEFTPDILYQAPTALRPRQGHARKHSEKQLTKLQASIREFGFLVPAIVDADNYLITGHARVEAAKRTGLARVPTICAAHLSPAKARAYRIADNRLAELGEWDLDLLRVEFGELQVLHLDFSLELTGWDSAEIDVILTQQLREEEADAADADGVEAEQFAVTRVGDVWHLGEHRLLCGSSLKAADWKRLLGDRQARVVFTDPPYNVPVDGHVSGLGKTKHREFAMATGEMTSVQFTTFLTDSIGGASAALIDGAVLFACMDWRHVDELLAACKALELTLLNICVWNKTNGGMGSLYRSKHELVLVLKKGRAPHINNVQLGKHGRYRTNVWDYAGANSFGKDRMADLADHPTVKPVALVADAIRDVSNRGDIVLDGFMGSGTTLLAAERTGRIACGIELDPIYVDVAIRRWEKLTGKQATLEGGTTFAEVSQSREGEIAEANEEAEEAEALSRSQTPPAPRFRHRKPPSAALAG